MVWVRDGCVCVCGGLVGLVGSCGCCLGGFLVGSWLVGRQYDNAKQERDKTCGCGERGGAHMQKHIYLYIKSVEIMFGLRNNVQFWTSYGIVRVPMRYCWTMYMKKYNPTEIRNLFA